MNTLRPMFVAFICWMISATVCSAVSDTDVEIIKATSVVIESDKIIITGEAMTTIIMISGDSPADSNKQRFLGRPCNQTNVKSDDATFVITRPHPKSLDRAWAESLDAAKALQRGEEIERIAFYQPDVLLKKNLIVSITGPAYLIPRGK